MVLLIKSEIQNILLFDFQRRNKFKKSFGFSFVLSFFT
jgi:hypothetical protein